MNQNSLTCKEPDRDVPGLICGHPIPCPYHTWIIKAKTGLERNLSDIADAITQLSSLGDGKE